MLLGIVTNGQSLQIPPMDTCEVKLRILADMMKQAQKDVAVILETDSILRRQIVNYERLILACDERVRISDRKYELKTEQYGLLLGEYDELLEINLALENKLKRKKKFALFGGGTVTIAAIVLGVLLIVK